MAVSDVTLSAAQDAPADLVSERRRLWPVVLAAAACPLAYVAFVWHFSVNALQFDDWSVVDLLHHPTWGGLWAQHGEPRLPVTNAVFLLGNSVGHLDTRFVMLVGVAALVGAYVLLLVCFRRYLDRPLGPLSVLGIGVVWFSLADTQNALWAFQAGWYLVLFFLAVVLSGLLLPQRSIRLGFGLALVAAVLGTLSWDTGFALWPVGLIALVWPTFRLTKRAVVWVIGCAATLGPYLIGYNRHSSSCAGFWCRPESPLSHPVDAIRYFLAILGTVFPAPYFRVGNPANFFAKATPVNPLLWEIVGTVLLLCSVYVIVSTIRQRRTSEPTPLPFLLVVFGLVFLAMVTWGRVGAGVASAPYSSRYSMAGLVVVTGLVMYAWKHVRPTVAGRVVLAVAAVFLAVQFTESTVVGWSNASNTRSYLILEARVVDNAASFPPRIRSCELSRFFVTPAMVHAAAAAQVAEFAPDQVEHYRALGPPSPDPACAS